MGTRLRQGARLATLVVVTVAPVLTGTTASTPSSAVLAEAAPAPVLRGTTQTPFTPDPPPQAVEPQTTLVAKADRHRTFTIDGRGHQWTASALASHDLPAAALAAYKDAAAAMARLDPSCRLPWTLLAGIGRVESDHGRYGGSVLAADGISRPEIIGVALNGRGPVAAIHDTDDGRLDHDKVWDRAVGPMQFIPSTWAYAGRDGDGDGRMNPHDLDDTALAAAAYLCSGSGSMLDDASARAAIFRYNPSDFYVALVQAFERGYRTGVFVIPSPAAPADEGPTKSRTRQPDRDRDDTQATVSGTTSTRPKPHSQEEPAPKPTSTSKPSPGSSSPTSPTSPATSPQPAPGSTSTQPTTPDPTPTQTQTADPAPDPTPTQEPLTLEPVSGGVTACEGGQWCIGARVLDFGPEARLSAAAAHDYDGDGSPETNREELAGLVAAGTSVTVRVAAGTTPAVVYVLDGHDYRFADGSYA